MLIKIDSYVLSAFQRLVDYLEMEPKKICTILANVYSVLTLVYVINLWYGDESMARKVIFGGLAMGCVFMLPLLIARIPINYHPTIDILRLTFLLVLIFSVIDVVTTMDFSKFMKDVVFVAFMYIACCKKPTPRRKTKLALQ